MNMKLSAVANNIYEKATEYKKDIKNTLDNTVKPFVDKQYIFAYNGSRRNCFLEN